MHHTIRPGLYYARAGGRTLFLDAHRNRYFSLAPAAEPDIERLEQGELLVPESPLIRAGLVVPSDTAFAPPAKPTVPRVSLLDTWARPEKMLIASLMREFAWARFSLVVAPKRALPRELAKGCHSSAETDAAGLQRVAGAYRTASHILGAHDQCLAWSLALMRLCRRRGEPVACVIGVSFRPFSAHAWVQSEDNLINDRYDNVRNFKPILAL